MIVADVLLFELLLLLLFTVDAQLLLDTFYQPPASQPTP